MNTLLHTCITDKKEKQFMGAITDKELAKVIRSKADELNVLLGRMARMDVSVSIGTESALLDLDVPESVRVQRVMVYNFSRTEEF